MRKFIFKITDSFQKIKQLRTLTVGAMLMALYVLSSFFLQFYPSESVKISLSFIFLAITGYLLGPVMGAIVGGLGDLIAWILRTPGPLNIGITLCMAAMGLLFGLFYYKEKPSLSRCIIASVTETVIIELILKTVALCVMYGTGFWATALLRLLPAAITLVIMILLSFGCFKAVEPIRSHLERMEEIDRR